MQEGELSSRRDDAGEPWTIRIPEGVREVIGRRLNRLSQRCNDTLTIASIIGREFGLAQLKLLVDDMSEDCLLDVMDEALGSRVVEELPRSVGRYQFSHAQIQQTLAEELSTTRRVRLNASVGSALEELYGDQAESHAAELAFHFGEAEALIGPEKLVRYALCAGQQAAATYAHEEALTYFQRALSAKEGQAMDAETADILYGLGRAQTAFSMAPEAWDSLCRAFDYYAESGDVTQAVNVAEFPIVLNPGEKKVTQLIARALELVPPDSHHAGRLLSRYGFVLSWETGNYDESQIAFNRALDIARREEDADLEIRTLTAAANVDLNNLRWQDGLEKSLQAIELAHKIGQPRSAGSSHHCAGFALAATGDPEEAHPQASALLALAKELRHLWGLASAYFVSELLAQLVGELGGGS